MKRWPLLLPFLFAVAPTLALYAGNIGQAVFSDTLLPLGIMVALTGLLLPPCALAYRSALKGAIGLSFWWWVVFSYGHGARVIGEYSVAGHNLGNPKLLLPVTATALVLGAFALKRARGEPRVLARVLLVFVIATLAMSAVTIVRARAARKPFSAASVLPDEPIAADDVKRKPDIFYIIFDRFASNSTMVSRYGYDNGPLLDYLRSRGFYVVDDSRANYLVTAQSLASSLNMCHLTPLTGLAGRASSDWLPVFDLLADYRLRRFLSGQGYRYVHVGPGWSPTAVSRYADDNVRYAVVPEFTKLLVSTTAAYPVLYRLGLDNPDLEKYRRIQYQLDVLSTLPRREPEPLFVFAHFLVPHNPYVFDRDGSYQTPDEAAARGESACFVAQVVYLDGRIRALVDSLTTAYPPENPPVIVIQGDEGPYPARTQPHEFEWSQASNEELSEKMRILNAIYAPGCEDRLYPSLTPVNTFRLLLNCYFGTRLEPLPDRSYSYRNLARLYDFIDVTERIDAVGD